MAKVADLTPQNEWANRLEFVREQAALKTFAAFVKRAARHGEFRVATARTWHLDRLPPPDYLEAVVKEFGVRAHWLLTGDGDPFELGEIDQGVGPRVRPQPANTEDTWLTLAKLLVDRGHGWTLMTKMAHYVIEFTHSYLEYRVEEPTPERLIEVMDAHFFMLREGFSPPYTERGRMVSGLHSALATAWLQLEEDQ